MSKTTGNYTIHDDDTRTRKCHGHIICWTLSIHMTWGLDMGNSLQFDSLTKACNWLETRRSLPQWSVKPYVLGPLGECFSLSKKTEI